MDCPKCGAFLLLARERKNKVCICCQHTPEDLIPDEDVPQEVIIHERTDYGSFQPLPEVKPTHELIQRVVIPPRIYSEMKTYCDLAPGEISGLGKIEIKDGTARIVAIALLEQENTAAHTEISEDTLTKFIINLARKGQSPEMWKVWWHTHHDFGTFWSGVDTGNISTLSSYMQSYLLSVELNKAGSVIARLDENETEYDLELCLERYKGYKKLQNKCSQKIKKLTKTTSYTHLYQGARVVMAGRDSYYD